MDYAPYATPQYRQPPRPAKPPRASDPLAVAVGNGSLLGIGYWLLGWRRLAVLTALISITLVSIAVAVAKPWAEFVVLGWWILSIALGLLLALRSRPQVSSRTQRLVALAVTIPVLLVFGILRYDAGRIGDDVATGLDTGDCAKVQTAQDKVWFGHRIANAPLAVSDDEASKACRELALAAESLKTGLTGDTEALTDGFLKLGEVLGKPGNDRTVDTTLNAFLDGLPTKNHCKTVTITDWLNQRKPTYNRLDKSADTAKEVAPEAILACANDLVAANQWTTAKSTYQQLLDQYGDDARALKAQSGVARAAQAIQLAKVRGLLSGSADSQPDYCTTPAPYSAAPGPHRGVNRALIYGNTEYTGKVPAVWRAADVTQAVFVVCAADDGNGTTVRTCPYENKLSKLFPTQVNFHKIAIPVKVFEVRTGRLVSQRTVQINGSSCPRILHYTTSSLLRDIGPPGDVYVTPTNAGIISAFTSLITR